MDIEVTREVLEAIEAAARASAPKEACGILLGEGNRIAHLLEAANIHPEPETRFEIDPQALIDAHRAEREGGGQVLGYFHSHPVSRARPSATDQAKAARDGSVWAISGTDGVTFWRDDRVGFAPLSYRVVEL